MELDETQNMINNSILLEHVVDETEEIDLAGYQVTKAEFFSHVTEPSVTIWNDRIKFNMACIRKFPGITHIKLLINVIEKRLIIQPCHADAPTAALLHQLLEVLCHLALGGVGGHHVREPHQHRRACGMGRWRQHGATAAQGPRQQCRNHHRAARAPQRRQAGTVLPKPGDQGQHARTATVDEGTQHATVSFKARTVPPQSGSA